MSKRKEVVRIEQDPEKPIERNVLAKAIVDISSAAKRLERGGLNRRAVVCLIEDDTINVGKPAIRAVLDSLDKLTETYTK